MHIGLNLYNTIYLNNTTQSKQTKTNFCSNPNSKLLNFGYKDFFINIKGYGKDITWAKSVKELANTTTEKIKEAKTSDEILPYIAEGIHNANKNCMDLRKRIHSGILRTTRKGYGDAGEWEGLELVTPVTNQYKSYMNKLKPICEHPIKSPYYDIDVAKLEYFDTEKTYKIIHPSDTKVNNALDRIGGKFFNLKKDYILTPKKVTKETLPKINTDIAEIRWILAHSMPWERGSDAISNIFMRSLYKSMGIKTYPIKKGISLDMEAFCTPLEEYKNNFHTYFSTKPEVIT